MSRKTIPRETEKPKKLTRAQKKEIDAVLRKYKGDGKPRTAQATIPYEAIYPDGVCRIDRRTFSKCIAFETSVISWPSRKQEPPSLNTCATCTTMWMLPSMCSFRF